MADYNPPTENLPIFDAGVFNTSGEEALTRSQADKRYLRFPNAQGTENLQEIIVNGGATFTKKIQMTGVSTPDKTIDMHNGEIHRVSLVHSENNGDITIEAKGTGDVILETANIPRLTISETGFQTFQGGMTYNNATDTLTAANFAGLATNCTNAERILITSDDSSGTYYLPFVKTSGLGSKLVFIDDVTTPLTYNPSTSTLTAGNFNGLASSASQVNVTDSGSGTYHLAFVTDEGIQDIRINKAPISLTYNASTNTITATTFNGLATSATNSTNASNLFVTSDNTSGTYYIPFSKTSGTNAKPFFQDDSSTPLTYDPSTSTLTATNFVGNVTGSITTATNANNISVTTDNTSGTYYIPFSKTSGTGNKALFQDDTDATNGPLNYNPSTSSLLYNRWDFGIPFIFDDFTSLETSGAIGWFRPTAGNVATNSVTVFAGVFNTDWTDRRVHLRQGLLLLSTSTLNAEITLISGNAPFRPCSIGRIDFGVIDLGSITNFTSAVVAPNGVDVIKTFGLSSTSTATGADTQNGIFFRVNTQNQNFWELVQDNIVLATFFGVNGAELWRFSLIFVDNGANFYGELVDLEDNATITHGPFTTNNPNNAFFLYTHLKSTASVTRSLAFDYIRIEPNYNYPIFSSSGRAGNYTIRR